MAIFALSMLAILALTGVVLDGGNIYVQRRTAQNSADAAALAGTRALLNAQTTPDLTIAAEICKYATANAFGVTPTPTAYFVGLDGVTNEGNIALPTNCSGTMSNVIPNGVVAGIHVDVSIPFHTYIAGIVGVANVTADAGATAQVGAISGMQAADAPVAGCGVMMDNNGSNPNIFIDDTPPNIDYATYMNQSFVLQSSQLWKNSQHPPCPIYNSGNGDWKGLLQGSGTIGITPGTDVPTTNGNPAADMSTPCIAAGMGDPALTPPGICYLAIPITDGNNPAGDAHVVALACMQVTGIGTGNDKWTGTLVNPHYCGPSSIYSYTYNWTWAPNSYTFARVALTK